MGVSSCSGLLLEVRLFVQQSARRVRELAHGSVETSPHRTLTSQRRDNAAVEESEHVLRPFQKLEIRTQAWLPQVTSTHGEFHGVALGEAPVVQRSRGLRLDGWPRVDDISHSVVSLANPWLDFLQEEHEVAEAPAMAVQLNCDLEEMCGFTCL